MYLYGKNSVCERLECAPASVRKVFVQDNFRACEITDKAKALGIPVKKLTEKELLKIKRADRLQGIVALADEFSYTPLEELLSRAEYSGFSLIFLDNINDPHNLGSLVRITACFGRFAVVIPKYHSCEVTDTVVHVASGGENFTPVAKVKNMTDALIKTKKAGLWIAGAVVAGGVDINKADLPFPLGLVLGSEGKGIRHGLEKHLDFKVSLPMEGAKLSFNVAMAGAIFCHEIAKKRPIAPPGK